jgi:putative oxidoreductase
MGSLLAFKSDDLGKLMLRLAVGGLILFHGISKLTHGIGWLPPILQANGLPGFIAYGVFIAEVVAPFLVILGVFTRLASLTIAFDMVMAVMLVMRSEVFALKQSGGGWGIELEAFFFIGACALFFMGSGKYGIMKGKGTWD